MAQHKLALLALLAASCVTGTYAREPKCKDIPAWGQCGGTGGNCGHKPEHKCADGPYPTCKCVDGHECTNKDERFWQCTPKHKPCTIPVHGQCGGKGGNCRDWKQCHDQPYHSCTCVSGSTCQKQDEFYYECRPSILLTPLHTHTTIPSSQCTVPKWGSCTPHHQLGLPPPEHTKHLETDGHSDDDCGKPGYKCGDDTIISPTHHCKCTWGTECRKLDHEYVWKCVPMQKPSRSPPSTPKVCLTTCKVVLSGESVFGICSKARTGSLESYRPYCPKGYTNSGEKCEHHDDCGVCCIKNPNPRPNSPPPSYKVCPTTCQVKVLYGKLVSGICSGSGGGHTSGKSAPCPPGYVSSGEKCDDRKGCGDCCVKNPVASLSPSPPPPPQVCPTTCEVKVLYGHLVSGICSGTGAGHTSGKSAPCPPGYVSSGEKCGNHKGCGDCCVKNPVASLSPSPPPPPQVCPTTCEVKVLYGQVLHGICSGTGAGHTGGSSTPCPSGYISSGEKCGNHNNCGECCLKTDASPSPSPPSTPSPPSKVCPTTCHSKKFEGYGSGVCSSSLASSYHTYCPPGYINSGEKCDVGHKECGVCCIR